MVLCEIKYQWAVEDGRTSDAEGILKKASRYGERIQGLQAIITHNFLMDWDEAIKENKRRDADAPTSDNSGSSRASD